MICPSCGQETDDQNQFCAKCGAPTVPQQPMQAGATGQPAPPPPPPGMQQGAAPPQAPPPPAMQQEAPPPPAPPSDMGAQGNVYYQPQGSQPPQAAEPPQAMQPPQTQPPQPPQATPPPQAQPPQIPQVPPPPIPGQYVQPTMQMPAAQVAPPPGTYQQPAYGQAPYAQPPQGQYPQQQYQPAPPGAPQYGQPFAPVASGKRGSTVLGLISLIMGAVMIGSTFLSWTSASAFGTSVSITGWNYMRGLSSSFGGSSFSIVLHGSGIVFFTGFFSLLLGFLILVFSMVMFFRRRIGGVFVFIFALIATGVAAVDLAMVFSKMPGGSPGVGLWMFVGASFVALILGIVGLASSGG
jgi:hypothetical protein